MPFNTDNTLKFSLQPAFSPEDEETLTLYQERIDNNKFPCKKRNRFVQSPPLSWRSKSPSRKCQFPPRRLTLVSAASAEDCLNNIEENSEMYISLSDKRAPKRQNNLKLSNNLVSFNDNDNKIQAVHDLTFSLGTTSLKQNNKRHYRETFA